jgi:hypothetical protein
MFSGVRFGGSSCGHKVSDALDRQMSKSWEHIGQIFADRNFEPAAAFDRYDSRVDDLVIGQQMHSKKAQPKRS